MMQNNNLQDLICQIKNRDWYGVDNIQINVPVNGSPDTTMNDITHPEYKLMIDSWDKWRLTALGGTAFMDEYLKLLSTREDSADFADRKAISYVPAFAKAALKEIRNAIFQRMIDITRLGGSPSYENAIHGRDKGVDRHSRTMNDFIGAWVLPELLSQSKVGVMVDMPRDVGTTQVEQMGKNPYVYIYKAEDIRSWTMDEQNNPDEFLALLLRDFVYEIDETTGLPVDVVTQYKYLKKVDGGVSVQLYDADGKVKDDEIMLEIPKIPLAMFMLSQSLLVDVADIQISLLNLASADMNYSFKSNFPFYTEQYDPRRTSGHIRQDNASSRDNNINTSTATNQPGTAAGASTSKQQEIVTGATRGRKYPVNTDRPGYIHPSSEPLEISMKKQEQLKQDIKRLINLAVSSLTPQQASAESKALDEHSLEAGLSRIGQELQHGETKIAEFWAMYEKSKKVATIIYPTNYKLKSEIERIDEAKALSDLRSEVSSSTYKKEVSKLLAHTLLSDRIELGQLQEISKEIDEAIIPDQDSETIAKDIEQGLLSIETASVAKGYPADEVKKAATEHAERAARIVEAQTKAAGTLPNAGARGVDDLDDDPSKSPIDEKKNSQGNKDGDVNVGDKTRGAAK